MFHLSKHTNAHGHLSTIKDLNSFDNALPFTKLLPLLLTVCTAGPLHFENMRAFVCKHLVTRTIALSNMLVLAAKQSPETDALKR